MTCEIAERIAAAVNLAPGDRETVAELVAVWKGRRAKNELRTRYYLQHSQAKDLCIAVPPHLRNLRQAVSWPAKAVEALADRSAFDHYTCEDDGREGQLRRMALFNGMELLYRQTVVSELTHGPSFASVTAPEPGSGLPAVVRCYPATASAGTWDYPRQRLAAGLVVVDCARRPGRQPVPSWVDVYTDEAVISIRSDGGGWAAEYAPHSMGRPLLEPFRYKPTLERPFGKSRISRAVMDLTDDAQRACRRAEIAAEFAASTQKYLLGAPDDVFEEKSRWDAALDAIVTFTKDAEGDVPQFGQLAQPSMQPHTEYYRSLASRLSAETNIPLSCLGVNTDANPQSSDAAMEEAKPLITDAVNLNVSNRSSLVNIAYMALAVENGTGFDEERASGAPVSVHFKDPSMPSPAALADAVVKQVSVFEWMKRSKVPFERMGYTDEEIERLMADMRTYDAIALFDQRVASEMSGNAVQGQAR